ncbi:MAG: insulinase family protein [Chlorobiaceae bacterium]|nr:insulinase family protein [Chlorobiaceae bacterium]MBA4309604.1 insulinase family protein [Chlorobiaceae bacterium]
MFKKILLILLIINGGVMLSQNKIFPYEYSKVKLDNGLSAILIPMESAGTVAFYTVVRTGSRDEWEDGKSGFAHFFEHMMFRGTERFPGNVYDSIVTSIGADANAYTSSDLTVYHLNFAAEDLETVIDIESDRFQNLKYTKEQFQTEAGAVLGEYRLGRTNPRSVLFEELRNLAFDTHTYQHTTIGFEEDIKNMPNLYEYSLSFYQRYYRPENCVVLIVGDFDKANAKNWIEKYYGNWKSGYVEPNITPEPTQTEARLKEVVYEGRTLPMIAVTFKSDEFDVNNKKFLSKIPFAELAFGTTSDLYKKLVLQEQKVTFISAQPGMTRDPYFFSIFATVKDEKDIDYVISEIKNCIEYFKNNLVDNQKLENLKKRNKYSFLLGLDSPRGVAAGLPQYIALSGGISVIDSLFTNLEKITPEDVKKTVNEYFIPERSNTIILRGKK